MRERIKELLPLVVLPSLATFNKKAEILFDFNPRLANDFNLAKSTCVQVHRTPSFDVCDEGI
jgi:hypothetical protein